MPTYRCEIITQEGKPALVLKSGTDSERIKEDIQATGAIFCKAVSTENMSGGIAVSHDQLLLFTRKLHAYIKAHLPLAQALNLLMQSHDDSCSLVAQTLRQQILEGVPLHQAMTMFPEVFSPLYCSSIRIGEDSGSLAYFLEGIIDHLSTIKRLREETVSALIYPVILVFLAACTVIGLAGTTVPIFEAAIRDLGQTPPGLTIAMVKGVNFVKERIFFLGVFAVFFGFVGIPRIRRNEVLRAGFDRYLFSLPLISGIALRFHRSVFSKTMALLLSRGIHLIEALEIATEATDNVYLVECLRRGSKRLAEIGGLHVFFDEVPIFSGLMQELGLAGEETGSLGEMFSIVHEFETEELRSSLKRLISLVEPMMILLTGILVGIMLVAMFLPIFKLSGSVQ